MPEKTMPRKTVPGKDFKGQGFSTRAIHAGHSPEDWSGAVNPPIFASSTFAVSDLFQPTSGHLYGRLSNPTRIALEESFASLEHAKHGNYDTVP